MPILSVQQKLRELGRIRLGDRSGVRGAPKRLEQFRFTSASLDLIEQAAAKYGGQVQPWESPRGDEWEVVSEATELDIVIPPTGYIQQWYESWSKGGCQRRCDGKTEVISMRACLCDPDDRECNPMTYLSVMLPGIQGLGTWRLVTGSWYAAEEMSGIAALLASASVNNVMVPAVLRIEARRSVKDGQTRRYTVPVIDARMDVGTLVRGELPTTMKVETPLEGGRATQRIPLGDQTKLPDQAASFNGDPDHGPAPALPSPANGANGQNGHAPDPEPEPTPETTAAPAPAETYAWKDATVPDDVRDAWQQWCGWIKASETGAELDALAKHFSAYYGPDDSIHRNIEAGVESEVRKRREALV